MRDYDKIREFAVFGSVRAVDMTNEEIDEYIDGRVYQNVKRELQEFVNRQKFSF